MAGRFGSLLFKRYVPISGTRITGSVSGSGNSRYYDAPRAPLVQIVARSVMRPRLSPRVAHAIALSSSTVTELFTTSGVRLRRRIERPGSLNWLLLPGGPGLGSESLFELADILDVPGSVWMVDLPGDGSNTHPPVASPASFDVWPGVLVEAAKALSQPVFVGHSTGGMYLLSVPELESHLVAMALVSSAPDAGWRTPFFEMTKQRPLSGVERTSAVYEAEKTAETLRELAVESAPWNFLPSSLEVGRELLRRLPYCVAAVDWSDRHFDETYVKQWWPRALPTLIVGGEEDQIVTQSLWERDEFRTTNVVRRTIADAAHFPWLENPQAVRAAFRELADRIDVAVTRNLESRDS